MKRHARAAALVVVLALVFGFGSPGALAGGPETPTPTPEETPTESPTPEPSATESPTPEPSATPTESPTPEPSATPTESPTPEPSATLTESPTPEPSATPTESPTPEPSASPTESPTPEPSASPTESPTPEPSASPTESPTPEPSATATESPTPSPSPSATETAVSTAVPTPEPLNHFLCYESHQTPLNRPGVGLRDQFDGKGESTVRVRQAKRLCAPADKNDEDPTAPDDVAHLTAYTIHQTSPRFRRLQDVPVAPDNPLFPRISVDLVRPERLLVPAAKNVGTQVPPALAAPIDHYKCYRVKGARTRLRGVKVDTQFGTVTVDVKRPRLLCTPADKNFEGIVDGVRHLMCYQVRTRPQTPQTVSTTNQFELDTFDIFGLRELCVPAFKFPGTCGDGVVNNVGEECESGDDGACPGLCDAQACLCREGPVCGNQVVEPGEQCEVDGDCPGGCTGRGVCTVPLPFVCEDCQCVLEPFCGDGTIDFDEECDDGNPTDGDGCESDCTLTEE